MLNFTTLTKREAPLVIKEVKEKVTFGKIELPDMKRFECTKKIGTKVEYNVLDILNGRSVMHWTNDTEVDAKVKAYINRCYGRGQCILMF
jgi:hypothetical protein